MVDLFFKNCSPNSVTSFKRDLNNGDGMCYCMSLEHLVQCLDGGRKKEIFKNLTRIVPYLSFHWFGIKLRVK